MRGEKNRATLFLVGGKATTTITKMFLRVLIIFGLVFGPLMLETTDCTLGIANQGFVQCRCCMNDDDFLFTVFLRLKITRAKNRFVHQRIISFSFVSDGWCIPFYQLVPTLETVLVCWANSVFCEVGF